MEKMGSMIVAVLMIATWQVVASQTGMVYTLHFPHTQTRTHARMHTRTQIVFVGVWGRRSASGIICIFKKCGPFENMHTINSTMNFRKYKMLHV